VLYTACIGEERERKLNDRENVEPREFIKEGNGKNKERKNVELEPSLLFLLIFEFPVQ
jgi:hypothetical protein